MRLSQFLFRRHSLYNPIQYAYNICSGADCHLRHFYFAEVEDNLDKVSHVGGKGTVQVTKL